MTETRKHPTTYRCAVRLHRDNAERLLWAVTDRPLQTLTLVDRKGDSDTEWISYLVRYGPVRDANRYDMTKFFDRLDVAYALSERGETEYNCDCEHRSAPCMAEIDRSGIEPYV